MTMLTNPVFLRMALLWFAAVFAFVLGVFVIRRLRRSLLEDEFAGKSGGRDLAEAVRRKKGLEV